MKLHSDGELPAAPRRDLSVLEPGVSRPRLRRGLRVRLQEFDGERCCILEDPLTGRFHRLGLPEYLLASSLDGVRTFAQARALASLAAGADALGDHDALTLLSWLVENGLVDFGSAPAAVIEEGRATRRRRGWRNLLNIFYIRLPLGNPDRLLTELAARTGFLFSAPAFGLWLAVLAAGALSLVWNANRFDRMADGVLTGSNGFWMALIWVVLKIVHETGHGLTCKHYRCPVRETGLYLILFFPVTYIDATASWSLSEKWKRIHVAAAGMWSELFVAALAALTWSLTPPGLLNTVAYDTVWMASLGTLFFNANPLMRFDGYYMLADFLETPNLYTRSRELLGRLVRRWLFLLPVSLPDSRAKETSILLAYGVASFVWRVTILFSLLFAAAALFKGGGMILALLAAAGWIYPVLASVFSSLRGERISLFRVCFRLAAITAALALLILLPVHSRVTAPALLQSANLAVVRAECPGFINRVFIADGDTVTAGQPLVELRNLEEETAVGKLRLKIEAEEEKGRNELENRDIASFQGESEALDGLRKQLDKAEARLATLNITAPVDGTVMSWKLDQRVGSFVQQGDEVVRVGTLPASELKIAVSANDVEAFRQQEDHPIKVFIDGTGSIYRANIAQVTARASTDPVHPELTSLEGGPLAVLRKQEETKKSATPSPADGYQLLDPVFEATANLEVIDGVDLSQLRSGQRAHVKFYSREGVPLWKLGYAAIDRLTTRLLHRARHAAEANSLF